MMLRQALALLRSKMSNRDAAAVPAPDFRQANAFFLQDEYVEATAICRQLLELQPKDLQSLRLLADIAVRQGRPEEALAWFGKITDCDPGDADAFYKRGNVLTNLSRFQEALSEYDRAIAVDPDFAKALCNRGVVMERLGRLGDARDSYDRAIAVNSEDALAHYNLAGVLRQLNEPQKALASYNRAIAIKPDYMEAICNRGILLAKLRQWDAAMASYDRAIAGNPAFFLAHYYRGALLHEQRQWDAALASYNRALEINPDHSESYCNRGVLFTSLMRWDDAIADLSRAIVLSPGSPEAHFGLGNVYSELKRIDIAIGHFDRAIALKPDHADSLHNRGNCYLNAKQFESAIASYDRVVLLEPDYRFLLGTHLHAKMNVCDWSNLNSDIERLKAGLERGDAVSPPFPVLTLVDSESLQLEAARLWVREKFPEDTTTLARIAKRPKNGKIRLGYFSADFYDHPVSVLTARLFELHDRSRFEVIAFSFGRDVRDSMRARLERGFDRFFDVSAKSDQEVALFARSLGVDIAIDLVGFTANHRTGIFALRAAPIQINYLGYPGTMGAGYIDYMIGDRTVVPTLESRNYKEKIIYLPGSYLPNDTTRDIAGVTYTRQDLGLPPLGYVFCCFNNNYKITPDMFARWMRILVRTEGSVLWLAQNSPAAAQRLCREAWLHGVDEKRLIFAKRMPSAAEHLSRHRAADLFLDTLPYNAHATAIDALWAGLPVLTCIGKAFAGRVAASLLRAIDLPELITTTLDEYEELAVQLASDRERSTRIREKLGENRLATSLFDVGGFVGHLEAGYIEAYERYQASLTPDHIYLHGT